MEDLAKMDGNQFLDLSIAVLSQLRKDFHGDNKVQGDINSVLSKLYSIKY